MDWGDEMSEQLSEQERKGLRRFTEDELRKYCASRPPEKPNPNSEPHTIVKDQPPTE